MSYANFILKEQIVIELFVCLVWVVRKLPHVLAGVTRLPKTVSQQFGKRLSFSAAEHCVENTFHMCGGINRLFDDIRLHSPIYPVLSADINGSKGIVSGKRKNPKKPNGFSGLMYFSVLL